MKKKAAFIDHSFHKKTLSTIFLKKLLSKTFELVEYYDETWNGGDEIDINVLIESKCENIFYFQFIHKAEDLNKLGNVKIVWFPMWDAVYGITNSEWLKYQTLTIKIVCFSKTLHDKLCKLGFDCAYFQYFINPQSIQPVTDYKTKRVYFWNRRDEINWDIIKKLIGNNYIDLLTFMAVPDPNQNPQIPHETDLKKYNIQLYDEFLDLEEYMNLVSNANIYIAPRKFEGIGMTFLEALCRGQFVIAPNFPVMNEYIIHGENGYLYNFDKLEEINLNKFELIGKEARERANDGFEKWQQQESKLTEFISDFSINRKSKSIILIKIKLFKIYEFVYALVNKIIYMIFY